MFWNSQFKLNFLQDLSDVLEAEGNRSLVVLEDEFMANLGKYRKYDHNSVNDLLRDIRKKMHHYHEMTDSLKKMIGPIPDGYYSFFDKNFPSLFITLFDYAEKSGSRVYSKYIKI